MKYKTNVAYTQVNMKKKINLQTYRKDQETQYIIYLFTNPSARARYDTRSIVYWSLTGLNSEFSFSKTSCLTKAEEPSLPYYLPIAGRRIIGFIPFPKGISTM